MSTFYSLVITWLHFRLDLILSQACCYLEDQIFYNGVFGVKFENLCSIINYYFLNRNLINSRTCEIVVPSCHITHPNIQHSVFFLYSAFSFFCDLLWLPTFCIAQFFLSTKRSGRRQEKIYVAKHLQTALYVFFMEKIGYVNYLCNPGIVKNTKGIYCASFWNQSMATLKCYIPQFPWDRWALNLLWLGFLDSFILQKWAISDGMDSYPAVSRTDASLDYHSSPHAFTLQTKVGQGVGWPLGTTYIILWKVKTTENWTCKRRREIDFPETGWTYTKLTVSAWIVVL